MKIAPIVLALALAGMGLAPVAAADGHEDVRTTIPTPLPIQDEECVATPEENQTVGGQSVRVPGFTVFVEDNEIVVVDSQTFTLTTVTVDPVSAGVCVT